MKLYRKVCGFQHVKIISGKHKWYFDIMEGPKTLMEFQERMGGEEFEIAICINFFRHLYCEVEQENEIRGCGDKRQQKAFWLCEPEYKEAQREANKHLFGVK